MQHKTVVGLGFSARVGKDTIADYLVAEHGFHKTSFATSLKEGIGRGVFGLNDDQLYGDKKEVVDDFWNERLNIWETTYTNGMTRLHIDEDPPFGIQAYNHIDTFKRLPITPRLLLQLAGTEGGRQIFGECLWVETVGRRIENSDHIRWVIPDLRFENEVDAVLNWGGKAYAVAASYPGYIGISGAATAHASETSLVTFDRWSGRISNGGSFSDLYKAIEENITSEWK